MVKGFEKAEAFRKERGAAWVRTPRSAFALNEDCINSSDTVPPTRRGEQFQMQTLTSFLFSKARGVTTPPCHPIANGKVYFRIGSSKDEFET